MQIINVDYEAELKVSVKRAQIENNTKLSKSYLSNSDSGLF